MTTYRTTDFWKNHIHAWNKSGLSQTEYARKHQLSVKTFGYHKRRHFNQAVIESVQDSQPLIPVSIAEEPVSKKQAPAETTETGISLISPGGFRVELAAGFDPDALKQVLNLLEVA
ncbi:hypothetical protein NX722_15700 [Endozoicomonas gorgoniicola]|uniref:Transposase n=1 Tax=Endozoicomonas gorgoniicola TaxID=1234144 RepID=A0ABT3MXC7_9GAMM|nr:hypothetical protein [Endozoicomonas gorgoniicola]MCW7554037.1 hypothetical protein [Endozoicomonas gorgoniicola]